MCVDKNFKDLNERRNEVIEVIEKFLVYYSNYVFSQEFKSSSRNSYDQLTYFIITLADETNTFVFITVVVVLYLTP